MDKLHDGLSSYVTVAFVCGVFRSKVGHDDGSLDVGVEMYRHQARVTGCLAGRHIATVYTFHFLTAQKEEMNIILL